MPEGGMPEVMGQARGIHDIRVGPQFLAQLAPHLGDLQGVSQPRAHEIVRNRAQDLRLFTQAAQRGRMQDARPVALELRAGRRLVLLGHPALRIGRAVRRRRAGTVNTGNSHRKLIHKPMVRGRARHRAGARTGCHSVIAEEC